MTLRMTHRRGLSGGKHGFCPPTWSGADSDSIRLLRLNIRHFIENGDKLVSVAAHNPLMKSLPNCQLIRERGSENLINGHLVGFCDFCLVRGICGSLMRSNRGRKFGSRDRRTPDSAGQLLVFVASCWLWNQLALPGKRYAVYGWHVADSGIVNALPSPTSGYQASRGEV